MTPGTPNAGEQSAARVVLFGIPIDNLSLAETVDRVETMMRGGKTCHHVVVNVDKIVKIHRDPDLREAVASCDLINADGQPIVWASRLVGQPLKERVTGIDLFGALIERCAERGLRPYLLGAKQDVVAGAAAVLRGRYPKLHLAGYRNGYWGPSEESRVVAEIKQARPDALFVAISSPKKELFIARWKHELQIPFVMGVGGTFDVVAGMTKRAPQWMQRCGLEWLYRLGQEPTRMWRRYLVDDMAFFGLLVREWWSRRR